MKKIIRGNGEIRFSGESGINSICFTAYKVKGPISLSENSCIARINQDNEIICDTEESYKDERNAFIEKLKEMRAKYRKSFSLLMMVSLISSIPVMFINEKFGNIMLVLYLFFFACFISSGVIGIFIERLKGNKKIISLSKFHAAEHAVINAYYDLHRIPTLDEIRNYSYFSYNCGSTEEVTTFLILFIIAIARALPLEWFIICLAFFMTIAFILKYKNCTYFMQFLVVSRPTEREYKVAIAELEYVVKQIKDVEIPENYAEEMSIILDFLDFLLKRKR